LVSGGTLSGELEAIRRRASDLAAGLSKTARQSATIAQERAVLRMLGIDGLDRSGRPLAAALAESYCGSHPVRLARGILLPFAVALLEYELAPRELALDVAAGSVDLAFEGELLARPDRLIAAERHASGLIGAALARFDANRTASREMREVLSMPPEPLLGAVLTSSEVREAARETRACIGEGVDVVQVRVPATWEFTEARRQAGLDAPDLLETSASRHKRERRPKDPGSRVPAGALLSRSDQEPVPAGSQRGLAELRKAADDSAAERGCYASLMTVASAFAAPEQAVVAAFERIDLVEADPIREIVEDNVDPGRALADHAFAHRLQARAGCRVVIGSGPLALGADVVRGVPSDARTQAGRGLAMQALGVELALVDGLPVDRLLLGAVPSWVADEGDTSEVFVQASLRRLLFPGHRLVVEEAAESSAARSVAALVTALSGGRAALVVRRRVIGRGADTAAELRAAAAAARVLRGSLGDGTLYGDAATLADRTVEAANATLDRLASEGWASLLGPTGTDDTERFGSSAVVERASGPGASAVLLEAVG
jgi:D-Lysine 5,6-aminomutase TIM-barrel domain of alpha subunit